MITVALESTAKIASAAISKDGHVLYTCQANTGLTHSQALLPMLMEGFERTGISPAQVDLYACTAGPGSFTGVRIAVSVIKGLVFGKPTPCLGVSTLMSLAQNLAPLKGIYCPVMDARREQVYYGLFRYEFGRLTRLCEDDAISLHDLATKLAAYKDEPIWLCGDGYDITYRYLRDQGMTPQKTPTLLRGQNAASTILCAERLYDAGEWVTADKLSPTYLRMPQAERERLASQNTEEKEPTHE